MTAGAGLRAAAYGSYYRVGHEDALSFEAVIDTALELGAPLIRAWAGDQPSADADEAYWDRIVAESRRIGDLAGAAGLDVTYEYHGGTLTDTNATARRLIERVAHERVRMYWQPAVGREPGYNLDGLRGMLPWLANVHVFCWGPTTQDRHPLADGEAEWRLYFEIVAGTGRDHYALLEFVQDDDPAAFLRDAETLIGCVGCASVARPT